MPNSPGPDPQLTDDTPVSFSSIDIRAELASRPFRPPDFEAEDRALEVLAAELAENPQNMLQKLAETALDLCRADTAGISLLEAQDGEEVFRWVALTGVFAELRNNTIAPGATPCGVCVAENTTQLMHLPGRHFPAMRTDPSFVEALMIPFRHQGRPAGTVWVVMHQFERKFDREDERLMRTLAAFASAGWQLWHANSALSDMNAILKAEVEERKRVETELRQAQEQLTNLPALLLQAEESERRSLARELHDDLTQKLAALSMQASALSKSSLESPDLTSRRLRSLGHRIGSLADEVHQMSHQIHPAILDDLGLEAALRDECTSRSRRRGIPVQFEAEGVPRHLPGDVALCLFRVAQESLRNIGKHAAEAKEVQVRLVRGKAGLDLFIEDTGDGFDIGQARGKGGLGLISMEERVRLVNGDFKIRSQPGVGTKVEVHVPLPEEAS